MVNTQPSQTMSVRLELLRLLLNPFLPFTYSTPSISPHPIHPYPTFQLIHVLPFPFSPSLVVCSLSQPPKYRGYQDRMGSARLSPAGYRGGLARSHQLPQVAGSVSLKRNGTSSLCRAQF